MGFNITRNLVFEYDLSHGRNVFLPFVIFYGERLGRLNLLYLSYLLVLITGVLGAIMPEVYSEGITRSLSNLARIGAMISSTPFIIENIPTKICGAC